MRRVPRALWWYLWLIVLGGIVGLVAWFGNMALYLVMVGAVLSPLAYARLRP